jgi:uncharacterized phage protein (TIGR02220 family)
MRIEIDLNHLGKIPLKELDVLKALVKYHAGQTTQQIIDDLDLDIATAQRVARYLVNDGGRAILPLLFCESQQKGEFDQTVHNVVRGMNEVLGTKYTHEEVRAAIDVWYRNGYTDVNDYIAVVKDRAAAWRHQPTLKTHLRPGTLFGEKFVQYLNLSKISALPVEQVKFNDEFTGI